MELEDFKQVVLGLTQKDHPEKIKLLGWYLHVHKGMTHFQPLDIGTCYDKLHMARPSGFGGYFANLMRPGKGLLKDRSGYRLEHGVRTGFDAEYGTRQITIQVTDLLLKLPDMIPDLAERTFLNEALICFKYGAFRAAIIMTWNLAYHHLCDYVLKTHLTEFNTRWPVVFPADHKKVTIAITTMDDFSEDLKESKVIEICNSAGIITNDVRKILVEKLGRRNSAAHPV